VADLADKNPLTGHLVIKEALARAPRSPGVYLMKDPSGKIIYVGKAKVLRNRLGNYARVEDHPTYYRHKVQTMVSRVARVEWVVTGSEKEALLLENTLIKRHRPRYNVDLRDDKSYPMLKLALDNEFPRLSIVRGPFDKVGAARKTLSLLQRIFPLRRCTDHTLKNRARPCLDYETGRCTAPCVGKIKRADYQGLVDQLKRFFAGQGRDVALELKRRMEEAAQKERFEQAAALRDRYFALLRTVEKQRVAGPAGGDQDVWALHEDNGAYRLAVLRVRSGRVVSNQVKDLKGALADPEQIMGQALLAFYDLKGASPPLLLLSHMPSDPGLVAEVLSERAERKVELRRPQRGEKRGLLDLALLNASQPRVEKEDQSEKSLLLLEKKLGLDRPPRHMECIDISHLGGRLTVASLVAFMDGKPYKEGYRRYKVLTKDVGGDDYAAMKEVVLRRLSGDRPIPDLLVVDGGKGQLNVACSILEEVPYERRPPLAALAKGRETGPDKVYLPGRKNPVNLAAREPALFMLMHLRDEAHRFAITYHRLLRRKALKRSILEEIPGVGPKKSRAMLKTFGSLAALKKAEPAEIAKKASIDQESARRTSAFLAALDTKPGPE
jgi:excinuclease ABC subunit C